MPASIIQRGLTEPIINVILEQDGSNNPATGILPAQIRFAWLRRDNSAIQIAGSVETIVTLGTYAGDADSAAWGSIDGDDYAPGGYQLHLPTNAVADVALVNEVTGFLTPIPPATDFKPIGIRIALNGDDPGLSITSYTLDANIVEYLGATAPPLMTPTEVTNAAATALDDKGLQFLVDQAVDPLQVADNSIMANFASSSATADWDDFDNTTDSFQAIRDAIPTFPANFGALSITAAGRVDMGEILGMTINTDMANSWTTLFGSVGSGTDIKTLGDNVASVKTTVEGLNDLDSAAVQTAADASLAAIHLDKLFAADYDPASKPGVATALLNELIVSDSGVSQFSTNALELGPSGGGGATLQNQVDTLQHLVDIKGGGWGAAMTLENIYGDTNVLQTEWADGGRLDVILDARASQASVDGLNDIDSAAVQTAADASLAAIFLDQLFAADYDPASKPGVATALLNELIVSDSGVSQFSTNALELGPSGGGGATLQNQLDTIQHLVDVKGSGWDNTMTLVTITADTDELQTDWEDTGRLDTILDSRSSQTSVDDVGTLAVNIDLVTATLVADLLNKVVTPGGLKLREAIAIAAGANVNEITVPPAGQSGTATIKDDTGTVDMVTQDVDGTGNRTANPTYDTSSLPAPA